MSGHHIPRTGAEAGQDSRRGRRNGFSWAVAQGGGGCSGPRGPHAQDWKRCLWSPRRGGQMAIEQPSLLPLPRPHCSSFPVAEFSLLWKISLTFPDRIKCPDCRLFFHHLLFGGTILYLPFPLDCKPTRARIISRLVLFYF